MRHGAILLGAGCVALAIVTAAVVFLVFNDSSAAAPTKSEYLAQVAAICTAFGPKLDKIRPPDVAEPANVVEAIGLVLPLLTAQIDEVRALPQPKELRTGLKKWFKLHDQRLAMLQKANRAGKVADFRTMSVAYVDFLLAAPKTAELSKALGIPQPPC